MTWVTKFFDDFDDASVGVQTSPGNGSITEPAGSELILSCVNPANCNWDPNNHNGPIAYEDFLSHLDSLTGLIRVECRLSTLVRSTDREIAGLTVWLDRDNAYQFGWYDYNDDVYVQRLSENVHTTQYQAGNYGDPNTTAHIYRIYWNRLPRRVWVQDADRYLEPGQLGFQFSANDGTSWVWALTQTPPFAPTSFGVWFRNFDNWPSVTAGFDYLSLEYDDDPNLIIGDQDPKEEERPQPSAQVEVEASPRSLGGYEGYLFGRGAELQVPDAQVDIEASLRDLGGTPASPIDPSRGELLDPPGHVAEVHIGVLGDVIDADYLVEKDDADGNELLLDTDVRGILVADTTFGSFGTPASNHFGAAKDGKYYYDGVECSPGDFGTIASGPNRTAWPNWSGGSEPFGKALPGLSNLTMPSDDVLRFQGVSLDSGDVLRVTSQYGWRFRGDFDIEIEYFDLSFSGGSDGGLQVNCFTDNYNMFYVRRRVAGANVYDKDVKINNSWGNYASVAATDTAGKMRIVRSGTVVSQYYWDGVSSWVQIGTSKDIGSANPAWVIIAAEGVGSLNIDVKVTNFTINSGSTDNTARWTWESSGDHRGTQATMPDKLVVATTQSTLELIDAVNDKLWMRFLQGTSNVMGATTAGTRVRRAKWSNGLLFVAYGNDSGGAGAALFIDFTVDVIRWQRTDADSTTGGLYAYPSLHGRGVIAERNNARGYGNDYTEWQIPDYKVDDVDIYRDGTYEYRAAATYAGMGMYKLRRWYANFTPEYSLSNETGHMRWCHIDPSTGTLYYMDDDTMFSRNRSGAGQGWEDWMTGGVWTAEYSKSLPGTRSFDFQKHAARIGSYIYLPADEGVYRVSWPSGSWELFYGKTLSGATHEILPDNERVTCLTGANDGSEDILVVGMERVQRGQVLAIKLSDNSIYGKLEIVNLKVPSVVAA